MSHYFDKHQHHTKSNPETFSFDFQNTTLHFTTDHGVFSKQHIDDATNLLLNTIRVNPDSDILDLGCGYGVIGVALAKTQTVNITMSDVNERALALTRINADQNKVSVKVIESSGFDDIHMHFDYIITNPPIRIGKNNLYTMFSDALKHLNPDGSLWIVMHKKHGVLSAIGFLKTIAEVEVVTKSKGFHVLQAKNR